MPNPIREAVRELFSGTPLQSEMLRTVALLRDIAREADSDEEIVELVESICKSIIPALQVHGKKVTLEDCVERLADACIQERSYFFMEVAKHAVRRKLRSKRFHQI
ncbi:MAG: hypothetical protein ABGW50_02070 [Thermococcus sp.]